MHPRSPLWAALGLALLLGCSPQRPPVSTPAPVPSPAGADWTLMFYLAADNDLEDSEISDLEELLKVGSTPQVDMVVLVNRSKLGGTQDEKKDGYSERGLANLGNFHDSVLARIDKGHLEVLHRQPTQNLADGATLEAFLKEARQRYPAQHYALFLADHGQNWAGACTDDQAPKENDLLTLRELRTALEGAGFTGQKPLDLLGFDACMMGGVEVARSVAGDVTWMLASEEMVPWSGLAYGAPLRLLTAAPTTSARDLGRALVESYRKSFDTARDPADRQEGEASTMALLDLRKLPALEQAVGGLADAISDHLKKDGYRFWLELARARSRAEEYGKSEEPLEPGADARDLGHLSEQLGRIPSLAAVSQPIVPALKALVDVQFHGRARPQANGLTIFFPPERERLTDPLPQTYAQVTERWPWSRMLSAYTDLERRDSSRPELGELVSDHSGSDQAVVTVRTRLGHPDALEGGWFVLVQDGYVLSEIPSFPEEGSSYLQDGFDGRWMVLKVGKEERSCPIASVEEKESSAEVYLANIPAQLQRDRTWQDVTLVMLMKAEQDGKLAYLSAGRRRIPLRAGDVLRLPQAKLGTGQRRFGQPLIVTSPDKLRLGEGLVPKGDYEVGFRIKTYAGKTAHKVVPVQVD